MISKHIATRTGAALFAAALALGATAASAAPTDPSKVPVAGVRVVAAKVPAVTKYCVVEQFTGSRLRYKQCRTRDDWIAREGFDPLVVKK